MNDHFVDKYLCTPRDLIIWGEQNSTNPLDYIHPLSKQDMQKVLNKLPKDVDIVILYGSCLSDYLKEDSDIDLAVISKNTYWHHGINFETNREVDIKNFPSLENLVEQAEGYFPTPKAILEEGLMVYRRGREVFLRDV